MTSRTIVPVTDVDASELGAFLARFYSPAKAAFLRDHGEWWHRGDQNRWVILERSELAGYCGVIPGRLVSSGEELEVMWWVDLVVAPEYRGRGLQRLFDRKVKAAAPIIAGFPNSIAARIHRRHGWGVHDDLRTLMMPLRPREIGAVQRLTGLRGSALRTAAFAMQPVAAVFRNRLMRWSGIGKVKKGRLTPAELERVFRASAVSGGSTTLRDEAFVQWRYFDSPFVDDLEFFKAGTEAGSEVIAVTRSKTQNGVKSIRILDLFGALGQPSPLRDVILGVGSDAVRQNAVQVTVMASNRSTRLALRSLGFVAGSTSRFCWWSEQQDLIRGLARDDNHWVLADSDNDEP